MLARGFLKLKRAIQMPVIIIERATHAKTPKQSRQL